ncbi:dual specificity protein phosphatase family protein [Pseudovibrio sp. Tun.PSC04-5.I4]|uniref:protein-tyrosine phosphatase family protein n=1 Tax=Pseudovibrio sp. Tun.PSC04-5.I4 TaxID=1798213 RepID=UPI00088C8B65|nr:dual specificity protein phosphatase family protein [Pseudovibrio sp. Tun.PSC04-5.I4]SDR45510.1 Dual specificity phosphatase, catalytic domain [Pseudovibrio sp. Tun.PSC04-5.I4]
MKPSIYPISADYPGQLFLMPKPSGEWLDEDMQYYRSIGVDLVMSMLEHTEAIELSLQNESRICSENRMDFLNFPIPDRGLPERQGFKEIVTHVSKRLKQHEGVAIHCRAGIGRSGLLACCVMAGFVGSAQAAIEIVSGARGVQVPDTSEQRAFIESVVSELFV